MCDTAADQCTVTKRAWTIDECANRTVQCSGCLGSIDDQQSLDIVSAHTIIYGEGLLPTLVKVNEAVLIEDAEETESLLHPFQAMEFGCRLNLTPIGYEDSKGHPGDPELVVKDQSMPFMCDGRKLFFKNRKPSQEELDSMIPIVLTSPVKYKPEADSYLSSTRRRKTKKCDSNVPIEEWRNRLALAPDDVTRRTLNATTHLASNVPDDNRAVTQRRCSFSTLE